MRLLTALTVVISLALVSPTLTAAEGDSSGEPLSPWSAPTDYGFAASANGHALFWATATREVDVLPMGGVGGHVRLGGPFVASINVSYARRSNEAGALEVSNTNVAALAGGGFEAWLRTLRLGVQLQAGGVFRTRAIEDDADTSYTTSKFAGMFGGRLAVGNAFGGRFLASVVNGVRFYPPGRLEFHVGLELGWLF